MFIRPARPRDLAQVFELVEEAFGRHDEALLVDSLRKDHKIAYEWVATKSEELVGHLVLSRLRSPSHCLALGPVSVAPIHRREGIGSALIHAALETAEEEEWTAVFVHGDPDYYDRFGFDVASAGSFDSEYPPEFVSVAVFDPGAFSGLSRDLIFPSAFAML